MKRATRCTNPSDFKKLVTRRNKMLATFYKHLHTSHGVAVLTHGAMQSVAGIVPIETYRLCLRIFEPAHLDALAKINSDPELMRHTGDGNTVSREETKKRLHRDIEHWRQHGFGLRAAIHKSDRVFIGFCGLQFVAGTQEVEVGFRLAKQYWGQGLATEAARAVVRHGFEVLGLDRIIGLAQPANVASQRVLEKSGLRHERNSYYYEHLVRYYAIGRADIDRIPL
jgi:RimJ/RimL family protein N-acetyltransferase